MLNINLRGVTNDANYIFTAQDEYIDDWKTIKAPVLLTHAAGHADRTVPLAHPQYAKSKLTTAELALFDVAGHITSLGNQAAALDKRIRAFLEQHK